MAEKKYCIMDMDGTIVDSMPYWSSLSPDYLRERGIEVVPEQIMDQIKTMTLPEACVYLKKKYDLPDNADRIAAQLGETMRRHYERDIPLKKGVREALEALRARGARLCVVTATAPPLVHSCLARLGVEEYFDFIMSCEEVGHGKDRPDAFLEAARRLAAAPEEITVYEDAFVALRTAKAAGFRTAAVYDPCTEEWEECRQLADQVIEDWEGYRG